MSLPQLRSRSLLFGFLCACTLAAGCFRVITVPPAAGFPGFNTGTYGTEGGTAWYLGRDGQLAAMVWCDREAGGGTSGTGSSSPSSATNSYEGRLNIQKGEAVVIACKTTNGVIEHFSINGKEYDLSQGALFLVTTHEGRQDVTQLPQDLKDHPAESAGLKKLAESNKDIREFLEKARAKKAP